MKKELQETDIIETNTEEYSAERCIECLYGQLEHKENFNKELLQEHSKNSSRSFFAVVILIAAILVVIFGFLLLLYSGRVSITTNTNITQTTEGGGNIITGVGQAPTDIAE